MDRLLHEYAQVATGGDVSATARPGQADMAHDLLKAVLGREQFIGVGPTGLGKSAVLLAVAFAVAVRRGERTVISTRYNALLDQVLTKDAPMMQEAARRVYGREVVVEAFKGQGNYVCHRETFRTVVDALREDDLGRKAVSNSPGSGEEDASTFEDVAFLAPELLRRQPRSMIEYQVHEAVRQVVAGASIRGEVVVSESVVGDRAWAYVSTGDCQKDKCPFVEMCPMLEARARASEAHVVVTNHTMVGLQAAKGVPVIIDGRSIGEIDHVMCDEAHMLVEAVRDHSTIELSASRVVDLGSRVQGLLSSLDVAKLSLANRKVWSGLSNAVPRADQMAARLDEEFVVALGRCKDRACDDGLPDPLHDVVKEINGWSKDVASGLSLFLNGLSPDLEAAQVERVKRVRSLMESLSMTCEVAMEESSTAGARWLQRGDERRPTRWCCSKIDVSEDIRGRIVLGAVGGSEDLGIPGRPVSFAAVSATLPVSFGHDVGLKGMSWKTYESPFDVAYSRTRLYVPVLTREEAGRIFSADKKPKMDYVEHQEWAFRKTLRAILHNEGRALLITTSHDSKDFYASRLSDALAGTGIRVFVQPRESAGLDAVRSEWLADQHAVLVGTASVATGTDARGSTCSLVVVDRVSRSPSNYVDDARRDARREDGDGFWEADAGTYVADAALRLEQSVGRLVRTERDYGVVMVLDPRLARGDWFPAPPDPWTRFGDYSYLYKSYAQDVYWGALERFVKAGVVSYDFDDVLRCLDDQRLSL